MVQENKGDLFFNIQDGDVIVHGCNCFCTMGAGFARKIAELFPEAYNEDRKTLKGYKPKLGTYTQVNTDYQNKSITIVNAYTQYHYDRSAGKDLFSYMSFHQICEELRSEFPNRRIIMPRIGSGLAGGSWYKIKKIIDFIFEHPRYNIVVYYV